jgi:hypothetical protein
MSAARVQSDMALYGNNVNGNYGSNHAYQQSYDAATTASGSGSYGNEPWANSTDPSSENSSVDRIPPQQPKADLGEQYGLTGFGAGPEFRGPIMEEVSNGAPSYGQPGYGQQGQGNSYQGHPAVQNGRSAGYGRQEVSMPPPPPPHQQSMPPNIPQQGAKQPSYNAVPAARPDQGEKRKSWLKRRFSKKE